VPHAWPLARCAQQLIRAGAKLVQAAADVCGDLKNYFVKETLTEAPAPPAGAPLLDKAYEMLLDASALNPRPLMFSSHALIWRASLAPRCC